MAPSLRLAVLISGRGSNLENLIRKIERNELAATIVSVISDRTGAPGLEFAHRAGLPTAMVDFGRLPDRQSFENDLGSCLETIQPDLILLAGFMRVLTPRFVDRFHHRVVNIHPSLLPAYPGLETHARVLRDGTPNHGATVHLVTDELDGGPILGRASTRVLAHDTARSLAERVLCLEHALYPSVLRRLIELELIGAEGIEVTRLPSPSALVDLDEHPNCR